MRILVRLALNWIFLEIILRSSAIGCTVRKSIDGRMGDNGNSKLMWDNGNGEGKWCILYIDAYINQSNLAEQLFVWMQGNILYVYIYTLYVYVNMYIIYIYIYVCVIYLYVCIHTKQGAFFVGCRRYTFIENETAWRFCSSSW